MKVGLIDCDSHRYPNLPLMKISAWHKAQGDSVEWYEPLFSGHMDRVYMSKVFSFCSEFTYVPYSEIEEALVIIEADKERSRNEYKFREV